MADVKPMTWEQFTEEAYRRGLDIREFAHTQSGIWQALDPTQAPKRVARGEWKDGDKGPVGWFDPLPTERTSVATKDGEK